MSRRRRTRIRVHPRPKPLNGLVLLAISLITIIASNSVAAADRVDLQIRPQPLSSALMEFARQSRVSLGFQTDLTDDHMSPGIVGQYSTEVALAELLSGSGLEFTTYAPGVIRIHAPAVSNQDETGSVELPEYATEATDQVTDESPSREEIITVGTRIGSRLLEEHLPVTVLDRSRIRAEAPRSFGQVLALLPANGANTFNGIDNYFYGVNDARGDVSSANLHELGSGNTLMLLNGRRIVNHPGIQAVNNVLTVTENSNALPLYGIERVEVLRDGASSIHGSDAVAGVVNVVVSNAPDVTRLSVYHGSPENSDSGYTAFDMQVGRNIGNLATVTLFVEHAVSSKMPASDRPFSQSSDMRPLFAGTAFEGDADLNNTSRSSAWGQFQLPVAVMQGDVPVTTNIGVFQIQPDTLPGCAASLPGDICIDDSPIDVELRSNNNAYRFLAPEIERTNIFVMANADIGKTAEVYGEFSRYDAKSKQMREPASPLSSTPVTIPANNYWNPFGPVLFSDGRSNPNRLPGIDAPADGLPVLINTRILGGLYRVVDAGPRIIHVENSSYRLLAGFRGSGGNWSWDGAALYSSASTGDTTSNRVSSTLFQQSLGLETPAAYNPFNGGDPARLEAGDGTPNPAAVIDSFIVDIARRNDTSLALADIQFSNPGALELAGRRIGLGLGAEVRREMFEERRSPRLNGNIGFTDTVTEQSYRSDVMQSSITPDSIGSRNVYSAFAELAIPIVTANADRRWAERIDAQFAARFEDYSDVGNEVRPRVALLWKISPNWSARAAWSRGLRAPNLPQVNSGEISRIQVVRDWYRCQALLSKGQIETLGACVQEGNRGVEVISSGSGDLEAETNETGSAGLIFRADGKLNAMFSIDYWAIDQEDIIGLFGEQNHVSRDYFLRLNGSSNEVVMRAPISPEDALLFADSGLEPVGLLQRIEETYLNLGSRRTRGIDIGVRASTDTVAAGNWYLSLEATYLLNADRPVSELGRIIVEGHEPAIPVLGAGDLIRRNGRPRWRAALNLDWTYRQFGAGLASRYVGSVVDTSAIQDQTEAFLPVDDWLTIGAWVDIRIPSFANSDFVVRFGVNNLFDELPPAADESLGYFVGLHDPLGRYWHLSVTANL